MTHFPKHLGCETCNLAKAQKKRSARVKDSKAADDGARPNEFGDLVTGGHVVFSQRDASHDNKRYLLTIYDRATKWIGAIPCPSKDTHTSKMALGDFMGTVTPKALLQ